MDTSGPEKSIERDSNDIAAEAEADEGSGSGTFLIVGIGASAGGLEAFSRLLSHLPHDTGMAFVLVQHLDPKHESKLTELLAKTTKMPVREITDGLAVNPNHVYIIPPNTNLVLAESCLHLSPRAEGRGQHLAVDHFFKSLANDRRTGAIGVILSGTGTDGVQGLEEIKAAGGITFAQDEATAKFGGMPVSATRSGCVDFVLPPDTIARQLARIGQHPYLIPTPTDEPGPVLTTREDSVGRILALLRLKTGVDFIHYRNSTISRRITRRTVLHNKASLADYAGLLEQDPVKLQALFQDLLINVTSFFRDPEAFEAL